MAKITLATVLMTLDKIEAKNDVRFELIKSEFHRLEGKVDLGFDRMNSEFERVKSEFERVNIRLVKIEENLDHVASQTAVLTNRTSDHERRIKKLETPSV